MLRALFYCLLLLLFVHPPASADAPPPGQLAYGQPATLSVSLPVSGGWRAGLRQAAPAQLRAQPLPVQGAIFWTSGSVSAMGQGTQLQLWSALPEAHPLDSVVLPFPLRRAWAGNNAVVVQLDNGHVQVYRQASERLHKLGALGQSARLQAATLMTNGMLVTVSDQHLKLYQVTKSGVWQLQGETGIECNPRTLQSRGTLLFAACGDKGLIALDLARPKNPAVIGHFTTQGEASDLWLDQDIAYLADDALGLTVVNVQNPRQMTWLGSNNKFGPARQLSPQDGHILVRGERGRLALLDISQPSQPRLISLFEAGSAARSVQYFGDVALVVDDLGLQWWNTKNAQMPAMNSAGSNLGGSRRVELRDNIAYVADWFSGLHLYDISNTLAPRHLSSLHTPGSAKGVLLMDNYAFVGDDDHGLQVVDISNASAPRLLASLPTAGLAYTMRRAGNLLYLADHRGGWNIIDITRPAEPKLLVNVDTPGKAWSLELYQHYVYIADDRTGMLIYDVANPQHPQQVGSFDPGGYVEDVLIRGQTAYVALFDQGLYILDLADPVKPVMVSHLPSYGNARGMALEGDMLYLADWDAGLLLIDVSKPATPVIRGHFDTSGSAWGVAVQGGNAYVMDWWGGFKVVDVSQPVSPQLVSEYHLRGALDHISLHQGYAYVAGTGAGLQVFDVNNPDGPIWMAGIDVNGDVSAMVAGPGRVYLATRSGGLALVDIDNPFQPVLLARHDLAVEAKKLRVSGGLLYLLDTQGAIQVWDMNEDLNPKRLAYLSGAYRDFDVSGAQLAVVGTQGASLLDMSAPAVPRVLANVPAANDVNKIALMADRLYLWGDLSGLRIFVRNAQGSYAESGHYALQDVIVDIQASGDQLILSSQRSGLLVLDILDASNPWLHQNYPLAAQAGRVAANDQAFFMVGGERLLSARRLPALATQVEGEKMTVQIPKGLPLGHYDLLLEGPDGAKKVMNDAFEIMLKRGGKSSFTLEQFNHKLKDMRQPPISSPN